MFIFFREEYEEKINTISIEVHFGEHYEHSHGALHPKGGVTPFIEFTLDRRKNVQFLKNSVKEVHFNDIFGHKME